MRKTDLQATLSSLGVRPSKRLGQSFLLDPNMAAAIVRQAESGADDLVVEIGPGLGALTRPLRDTGCELILIEYDHRLADWLATQFADTPKLRVLAEDATQTDYDAVSSGRPWVAIGSLPYRVAAAILTRIAGAANPAQRGVFLLQQEMGERLAAGPGSKDYGSLGILLQARFEVAVERTVPPTVFWPTPAVDSAIVTCDLRPDAIGVAELGRLERLLRAAFAQRRKTLVNNLRDVLDATLVRDQCMAAGLPTTVRPERVPLPVFKILSQHLD